MSLFIYLVLTVMFLDFREFAWIRRPREFKKTLIHRLQPWLSFILETAWLWPTFRIWSPTSSRAYRNIAPSTNVFMRVRLWNFLKEQSEKNFASSVFSFWKSCFYRRLLLSLHATDKNDDPRDFFPDIRVASWTPWHQGRVSQGVTV